MQRIRRTAERLAEQAADMAHIAALGLVVCSGATSANAQTNTTERDTQPESEQREAMPADRPLERQLNEMKQAFGERADAKTIEVFEKGVRDVAALGLVGSAKQLGDEAPRFSLPDASGGTVQLSELLEDGPVVVTFYRGGWCPYCNIQLRAYQKRLGEITALGAHLVAISPELPDASLSTKEKSELTFHVLSDQGNEAADAFGIRYRLPDELIEAFKGRLDLESQNGDGSWTLPLGATYVIDTDGTIAYAFLSADYRERAEPQDIIDVLERLAEKG